VFTYGLTLHICRIVLIRFDPSPGEIKTAASINNAGFSTHGKSAVTPFHHIARHLVASVVADAFGKRINRAGEMKALFLGKPSVRQYPHPLGQGPSLPGSGHLLDTIVLWTHG
jgi:hypothetical protein